MKNGLKAQKSELREEMLALRLAVPSEEKARIDRLMRDRFLSLASFRFAETVLLFSPIKGEPDLTACVEEILRRQKKVAFPRCSPESCTMTYHIVSSLDDLIEGSYGIKEPRSDCPIYLPSPAKHDLCIVPAVCFDRKGYRVGYGKGYYDRFLGSFGGTTVGLTLHRCFLPEVPRGRYDRSVDLVITEKGVFPTR